MIEFIESLDRDLFLLINGMNSEWLDPIMYLISNKLFWLPVYVFIFYLVQRKFGWKRLGYFAIGVALVILLCDQLSSTFIKPLVGRYRPCNNLDIMDMVHKVNDRCGRGFSFVSGHATNYFGVSIFAAHVLKDRRVLIPIMLWAALIAYSRVYLGVHYPGDVIAGALLGLLLGTLVHRLYDRISPIKSES